jgi:hypothetical protein
LSINNNSVGTTIYAFIDYRGYFGSKCNSIPYESGMDKKLLEKFFYRSNFKVEFISFTDVVNYPIDFWKNKPVIYTSSEDTGYHYKGFIEDIVYFLELSNAKVIPAFKYLKANNNKVFMELLRNTFSNRMLNNITSKVFGTFEELEKVIPSLSYPLIFKQAAGAMSKGVGLAKNQKELIGKIKTISRTRKHFKEFWERGRAIKYKGYIPQSKFRGKFIVQDFIDHLNGDYKVLVFGEKYFVLKRDPHEGDFRASGSGIKKFIKEIPSGILEYAYLWKTLLNVPNASLDIAYNGNSFFLLEFQCLYFGSYTLSYSDFYWKRQKNKDFQMIYEKSILEEEYAQSIVNFCNSENL